MGLWFRTANRDLTGVVYPLLNSGKSTMYFKSPQDKKKKKSNIHTIPPILSFVSVLKYKNYDITKTYLYNFDPLKPPFYIVKLGFTGVCIILISAQKHRFGYSIEPPHGGGSNEYPQSMF